MNPSHPAPIFPPWAKVVWMTSERGRQPLVPTCGGDDDPVLLHRAQEHPALVHRLNARVDWPFSTVRSRAKAPGSDRDLRAVVTPFQDGMGVGRGDVPARRVVRINVQIEGLHQLR